MKAGHLSLEHFRFRFALLVVIIIIVITTVGSQISPRRVHLILKTKTTDNKTRY